MIGLAPDLTHRRIEESITRLRALREGERAMSDLLACGDAAVGPLHGFLFAREPNGIFLPRCQAVEVLSALGAKDALVDFLAHPPQEPDPVEQAGIDVVTSAVARALMQWPDDQLFSLLLQTAGRKLLPGVVEALAEYGREEAIPILSEALGEDFCRSAAERGFRRLGTGACPHLLQLAASAVPAHGRETEMSRRRRRSALRLWGELYQGADAQDAAWSLTDDADDHVAYLACTLCLRRTAPSAAEPVALRLVALLKSPDWLLRVEVEDLLVRHFAACRTAIERSVGTASGTAAMSLHYVLRKASPSDP